MGSNSKYLENYRFSKKNNDRIKIYDIKNAKLVTVYDRSVYFQTNSMQSDLEPAVQLWNPLPE